MINFFNTLFKPGENVCWGMTAFDTNICPVEDYAAKSEYQFFSVNPLVERRLDACVTSYRNILCDFDKIPIFEQQKLLVDSALPYTTLVYSGGKSLHAIVSLQEAAKTEDEYRAIATAIYDKLGGDKIVDVKCKNPSRFSRNPGASRPNGKKQELLAVNKQVSMEHLLDWIGVKELPVREIKSIDYTHRRRILTGKTKLFLFRGADDGAWNNTLFVSCIDMFKAGYDESEVEEMVYSIHNRLEASSKSTIRSAQRTAMRGE